MTEPRRVKIGGDLFHPKVPEGARRVDRATRWGNPHKVGPALPASEAVALYRADLLGGRLRVTVSDAIREIGGRDLACWCAPDAPCHGDVLLGVANPGLGGSSR